MRFSLKHPSTGKTDAILTMTCFIVVLCGLKFLFDGVEITIFGHIISFGHADPMAYGTLLTPVLGAHGAREWRNSGGYIDLEAGVTPDDPDNV